MPRRRESPFETVMRLPWWAGVTIAVVGYLGIGYAIPAYLKNSSPLYSRVDLEGVARIWFGIFVFAAAMSLVRSLIVRRKFDIDLKDEESIKDLSWSQFEVMVGEAFRRLGYTVIENGGGGADGKRFWNICAVEVRRF